MARNMYSEERPRQQLYGTYAGTHGTPAAAVSGNVHFVDPTDLEKNITVGNKL